METQVKLATAFLRLAMLPAMHRGDLYAAAAAADRLQTTPVVSRLLKAAVPAMGLTSDLADFRSTAQPFVELLNADTIPGRLQGLIRASLQTRIIAQTGRPIGQFVAPGAPKPLGAAGFTEISQLPPRKVASPIVIFSRELDLASPSALAQLQSWLIGPVATAIDTAFVDGAAGDDARPASVAFGAPTIQSSGSSAAQITADLRALLASFDDPSRIVLVAYSTTALHLSAVLTTGNVNAFPQATVTGGTIWGVPLIVSNAVVPSGSPTERTILALDPSRIIIADNGDILVDQSEFASVQADDSPAEGAQNLISLWQNGLIGIILERYLAWTSLPGACAVLAGVNY